MLTRLCKLSLVGMSAAYLLLVGLNNALFDHPTNYVFVEAVLSMDAPKPFAEAAFERLEWRAIEAGWAHRAVYWLIIAWELAAGALCAWGCWSLWRARQETAEAFQRAKAPAIAGLTLALLLWGGAFLVVGGEWFSMWASAFNGQAAATRLFTVMGITLLFLNQPDPELPLPKPSALIADQKKLTADKNT